MGITRKLPRDEWFAKRSRKLAGVPASNLGHAYGRRSIPTVSKPSGGSSKDFGRCFPRAGLFKGNPQALPWVTPIGFPL